MENNHQMVEKTVLCMFKETEIIRRDVIETENY